MSIRPRVARKHYAPVNNTHLFVLCLPILLRFVTRNRHPCKKGDPVDRPSRFELSDDNLT
ncbi:hypothetical protein PMI41_00663, partial [Phyllobacterium sp. YR531]